MLDNEMQINSIKMPNILRERLDSGAGYEEITALIFEGLI
jgi:hypothetical protein